MPSPEHTITDDPTIDPAALDAQSRRYSQGRLALVALVVGVLIAHLGYGALPSRLAWTLVVLGVGSFLVLAVAHDRLERRRRRAEARRLLARELLARRARQWDALPYGETPAQAAGRSAAPLNGGEDPFDAIAADLDLLGPASLRQLLGRTASPLGEARLLSWLRDATAGAPADLAARQQAVSELAGDPAHRTAVLVEGMAAGALRPATPGRLERWLDAPPTLLAAPATGLGVLIVPGAAVGLVVADLFGARVALGWLGVLGLAWGLRAVLGGGIRPAFAGADALSGEVRRYGALLAMWEARTCRSPWLIERRERLTRHVPASVAFASLARLVDLSDLRWSHLPHVLVHSVTGWDLHVACGLERWRARHGRAVGGWLEALGDLDAAAALGALTDLEAGWTYPDVDAAHETLRATDAAHPLLPAAAEGRPAAGWRSASLGALAASGRVGNDVVVGPPGRVVVITGSNMSGKSTWLRAVGVNAVLAQMGAPVCAATWRMPSVRLATSLRLADSLASGVSYFMAALLRLKDVVAAADAPRADTQSPRVLYLLDEVLQGTNSEERQIAVRHIVAHLVGTSAIGAITTHDLHLVQAPEFLAHADHWHFSEELTTTADGEPELTFDYRLRPGPAQSRNALALVQLVGLGHVTIARPGTDADGSG